MNSVVIILLHLTSFYGVKASRLLSLRLLIYCGGFTSTWFFCYHALPYHLHYWSSLTTSPSMPILNSLWNWLPTTTQCDMLNFMSCFLAILSPRLCRCISTIFSRYWFPFGFSKMTSSFMVSISYATHSICDCVSTSLVQINSTLCQLFPNLCNWYPLSQIKTCFNNPMEISLFQNFCNLSKIYITNLLIPMQP